MSKVYQNTAFREYVQQGGKYLRCGYTTGTCAALAAAAAAELIFSGRVPESVSLITPKGVRVDVIPEVCEYISEVGVPDPGVGVPDPEVCVSDSGICGHSLETCGDIPGSRSFSARAAVRKDAGDDQDVTDGILIWAAVTAEEAADAGSYDKGPEIRIEGGKGVGQVTKPGLDQPVGTAAINRVPREMIEKAVRKVCDTAGFAGMVRVVVSVPEGEKIAKRTFNEHLGIEGGISILGTSGIVEPMSMQAFIDAVCLEIRQVRRTDNTGRLILTPGNYGMEFLGQAHTIPIVKCSNFIGDALDAAAAEGFREVLLVGHIGKLVKLAGGIMNTHSRYADCRMELFAAHAAVCGAGRKVCRKLMDCVTTDACLEILKEEGICQEVMEALLASMDKYLQRRVNGAYTAGAVTFSNKYGLLGSTAGAQRILENFGFSGSEKEENG